MNPDFLLCDMCGSKVPKEHRMFIATGHNTNPASDGDDGEYLDPCGMCACALLKKIINNDHDTGKTILKFVRRIKEENKQMKIS